MENKILKIGIASLGGRLILEGGFLNFKHPYRSFRVLAKDIETVTVDVKSITKGILKIIGHGTELASVEMPINWAHKCQSWILENK